MTKRLLSVLLTVCMLFGMVALTAYASDDTGLPFKDIKLKHWYYSAVKNVYDRGIMEGKTKDTFVPLEAMTRAQIVTTFYRLSGATATGLGDSLSFTDVKKNGWYADYIGWAVKEDLVSGYPEGTFRPDDAVSRQELAKLLVVFLEYMSIDITSDNPVTGFADSKSFPKWSRDYIEALRLTGLVRGDDNGMFNPTNSANRAEVATIFSRLPDINVTPSSFIENPTRYLDTNSDGKVMFTFGNLYCVGTDVAREILATAIIEASGLDASAYTIAFENDSELFSKFPGEAYINADHGSSAVFSDCDVKIAVKDIASDTVITDYVSLGELVLNKDMSEDVNNALPDDGYTFLYNDVFGDEDNFKHWLKVKVKTSHDEITLDSFDAIKKAADSKGTTEFKVTFTVSGKTPAITTQRTYKIDFSNIGTTQADDPTPSNIGTVYEDAATGLKISQALVVDDGLGSGEGVYATGTGTHGWHESRVVRTTNGTYVAFISEEKHGDVEYKYGSYDSSTDTWQYTDTFDWDHISVIKITSNGCKVVLDNVWYPHCLGSCTANVNQTKDGNIILTVISEDKAKYYESWDVVNYGFKNEGAWLRVYEIDTETDTLLNPDEDVYLPDFKKAGLHGYGYSQPVIDEETGLLYCMYNSGEVPGYWSWYTYDLNTHEWVGGPYLIEIESRCGYMNVYPDGNGGVFFIAQRHPPRDALEELLGVTFKAGGYGFDTTYLFAIPDMTKEECFFVDRTYEPVYPKDQEDVYTASANHYAGGTTFLDSNGHLHVIYAVGNRNIDMKLRRYHTIYDVRDNYKKIKDEELTLSDKKNNSYYVGMGENTNGDIFIIGVNAASSKKGTRIEVYQSTDGGMTFSQLCDAQTVTVRETGEIVPVDRTAFSSTRNYSTQDNVIAVVTHGDAKGVTSGIGDSMDYYYYYSIELPH